MLTFLFFGLVIPSGGFKTTVSQAFILDSLGSDIKLFDVDALFDFTTDDELMVKWRIAKDINTQDKWNDFNNDYYVRIKEKLDIIVNEENEAHSDESQNRIIKIVLMAHHWEVFEFLKFGRIKVLLLTEEKFEEVLLNEKDETKRMMMRMNRDGVKKFPGAIEYYTSVTDLKDIIRLFSASATD